MIISDAGWVVPHSHNGNSEALLGLGIVGTGIFVFCPLRLGKDTISYARLIEGLPALWAAVFLRYFLLHAMTGASLLQRDGLSYLIFICVSTALLLDRYSMCHRDAEPLMATAGPQAWELSDGTPTIAAGN